VPVLGVISARLGFSRPPQQSPVILRIPNESLGFPGMPLIHPREIEEIRA